MCVLWIEIFLHMWMRKRESDSDDTTVDKFFFILLGKYCEDLLVHACGLGIEHEE